MSDSKDIGADPVEGSSQTMQPEGTLRLNEELGVELAASLRRFESRFFDGALGNEMVFSMIDRAISQDAFLGSLTSISKAMGLSLKNGHGYTVDFVIPARFQEHIFIQQGPSRLSRPTDPQVIPALKDALYVDARISSLDFSPNPEESILNVQATMTMGNSIQLAVNLGDGNWVLPFVAGFKRKIKLNPKPFEG